MKWRRLSPQFIEAKATKTVRGCWDWLGYRQSSGYGQVSVDGKRWLAHRLSWIIYRGAIPEGKIVMHLCDRPCCVNPAHLLVGDHWLNAADCDLKGRRQNNFSFTRGKRIRKLTDDQVREIRKSKEPLAVLSARYGVSVSCVSTTRRRKRKQLVT